MIDLIEACRANVKCLICGKRHSTVLCPDKFEHKEDKTAQAFTATASMASTAQKGETLLQTIIIEVEFGGKKQKIRALLDSGSQRTYVKKEIVEEMNIPPAGKEVLTHVLWRSRNQVQRVQSVQF